MERTGRGDVHREFPGTSGAVRERRLPVAMVWNVVVGGGGAQQTYAYAAQFYPGDEWVD